jgi:asparagine synthase (glutamine-hydrolysing)
MCGIAGMIDLAGERIAPKPIVTRMTNAIIHRGPDDNGHLEERGLQLGHRRLSIVGLKDGKQPIGNEDGSIQTVFNGEFFDYPEKKAILEARGHKFRTHTDTELIPHSYEEYGDQFLDHLQGQFSFCLYDRNRQRVILTRDRFGILPLFYTIQRFPSGPLAGTDWLMFCSEIKGLLATGLITPKIDPVGINQVFSMVSQPGPCSCFEGITQLPHGHYLQVQLGAGSVESKIQTKQYWDLDFPDRGQEENPADEKKLVDDFEKVFYNSVERRLRADVPVVAYLSGGVDSNLIVAMASKILGRPIPTFSVAVQNKALNEQKAFMEVADYVGTKPDILDWDDSDVQSFYPELIRTTECPVVDTACAAMQHLSRKVRASGFKVSLSGEGADESLAGYRWFRIQKVVGALDFTGLDFSSAMRRVALFLSGQPQFSSKQMKAGLKTLSGANAWQNFFGLMGLSRQRFYNDDMKQRFGETSPYESLILNQDRMKRWHPMHRSLYLGFKTLLPGMLLSCKADRVGMSNSVEGRYPFLDEEVVTFLAKLHPRWKLRGFREKYLERCVAERYLPKEIAWRKKFMFTAPLDSFHVHGPKVPKWIDEVLSPESLKASALFDPKAVAEWREKVSTLRGFKRSGVEMGLVAVVATQLWYHSFISGNLTDLPHFVKPVNLSGE